MIDGPGVQQSPGGGVTVRYFSSSASVLGRWLIQTWSCESTATPENSPKVQLLGSAFGQGGYTSNVGPPAPGVRPCAAAASSRAAWMTPKAPTSAKRPTP